MGAQAFLADTGASSKLIAELGRNNTQPSPMLHWDCVSASDRGHERSHNEDATCLNLLAGLMILADGMGGYNAGEVASALAIENARDYLCQELPRGGADSCLTSNPGVPDNSRPADSSRPASNSHVTEAVSQAIAVANASILAAAARRPECLGMGTTLVIAAVSARCVTIGHVGDSRVYLLRAGRLSRLTHDHSVGQAMIDSGVLDEQAARLSTLRGVLTRALGVESAVDADISQLDWQNGDRLLLCSDGLTDMVRDSEIKAILEQATNADEGSKTLIQAALDAGGHDNISVVLAFCNSPATL
jgi:PPM family protein phosphatase